LVARCVACERRKWVVFKAHRLLYHSTLGVIVMKKTKEEEVGARTSNASGKQNPAYNKLFATTAARYPLIGAGGGHLKRARI